MENKVVDFLRNQHYPQHSYFAKSDWQCEVANDDTSLGYWEWVLHQIEGFDTDADEHAYWRVCLSWMQKLDSGKRQEMCKAAFAAGDAESDLSILVDILYEYGWPVKVMDSETNATIAPVLEFAAWCAEYKQTHPITQPEAESSMGERSVKNTEELSRQLRSLAQQGLEFCNCISVFAAPNDSPYIQAARDLIDGSNDMQIDESSVISSSEEGAWVLTWLWVSNSEAGIET